MSIANPEYFRNQKGIFVPAEIGGGKAPHTGTTAETAIVTRTIPGGAMGANGLIWAWAFGDVNNDADEKRLRFKLGSATILSINLASQASFQITRIIQNQNSESAQAFWNGSLTGSFGVSTSACGSASQNTALDKDFVISAELADDATDSLTLLGYGIIVSYKS